jgi:hypothetical protein
MLLDSILLPDTKKPLKTAKKGFVGPLERYHGLFRTKDDLDWVRLGAPKVLSPWEVERNLSRCSGPLRPPPG